jgi:hypothetical protein
VDQESVAYQEDGCRKDKVHMKPKVVVLESGVEGFIDDKDAAKRIRMTTLIPALEKKQTVVLDFKNVTASTQSFVHALVGEALNRFKEPALDHLEFRNCSPQVRSLIELVVDYSLGGFNAPTAPRQKPPKKSEKARG